MISQCGLSSSFKWCYVTYERWCHALPGSPGLPSRTPCWPWLGGGLCPPAAQQPRRGTFPGESPNARLPRLSLHSGPFIARCSWVSPRWPRGSSHAMMPHGCEICLLVRLPPCNCKNSPRSVGLQLTLVPLIYCICLHF